MTLYGRLIRAGRLVADEAALTAATRARLVGVLALVWWEMNATSEEGTR